MVAQLKEYSGFPFPAVQRGPQGALLYARENTKLLVKSSLLQILLTSKGEREWLPEFGCDLVKFLFESGGAVDAETVINLVYDAITTWERRVKLSPSDISVGPSSLEEGSLQITVNYAIVIATTPVNDSLTLTV